MAISNDWQIIDNLTYSTFSDESALQSDNKMLDADSAEKVAAAMGWEVVELSDTVAHITIGSYTYDASNIRVLRPVAGDGEEYNCGIIPVCKLYYSNSDHYPNGIVNISNGTFYGPIGPGMGLTANCRLLRPDAVGSMLLYFGANKSLALRFDVFQNVKTTVEKWGVFTLSGYTAKFSDLYAGLQFTTPSIFSGTKIASFTFGQFVILVKVTMIAAAGIYKAKTMYRYLLSYGSSDKTIELDGEKYLNINGDYFYIRLAE